MTFTAQIVFCQYSLSGRVFEEKTKKPIEYASVVIDDHELWAITNDKGEFLIKNVLNGDVGLTVSCLGYAKKTFNVNVSGNRDDLVFYLPQDNLTLKEVVVTAQNKIDELATSHVIDRAGLDHLQMQSVPDVMGLLPGGQTNRNLTLATSASQTIALRSTAATEYGNPSFGTAIEVDGVRLSNNAIVDPTNSATSRFVGSDTRNIASSNIASIELITGIPSVAYGDLSNGIVKISTRKGKSPYIIEMSTNPNTKQFSLSKGFSLGQNAGTLNANIEKTNSISDPASPYTTYQRNSLSLLYENTFNITKRPFTLTFGLTGNIGGYNDKADPDKFVDTYTKIKDNTYRIQAGLNYLLNKSYITNLELSATYNYSDKLSEVNTNKSSSSSVASLHGQSEGYFVSTVFADNPNAPIVLIPPGFWYEKRLTDNKPIDFTGNLKARLVKKTGIATNNFLLGANFTRTGNKGKGVYYDDLQYAPTWREYRYDLLPYMNNLAVFLEDRVTIPINKSVLQLVAGIRSDMTMIKGSDYGNVNSLSPRFNAMYIFPENKSGFVERFNIRAGWGKAVKLPSFSTLYPAPVYTDKLCFTSSVSGNENYSAYNIFPHLPKYNPDLKWQYSNQTEAGINTRLKGVDISISVFNSKTINAYQNSNYYDPFSYKFTDPKSLDNVVIPPENRQFSIDQQTGIVTVSDKTGQNSSVALPYIDRNTFNSGVYPINGSPSVRRGVEWTVDFGKIQTLQTSIRWDGNYYYYRGLDETVTPYVPNLTQVMSDGRLYQYIAFYAGGNNVGNGTETKQLHSNLTFTAHIPALRFIVSLRIESCLYSKSQYLSEYNGQPLGFVLDNQADYFPSTTNTNIYAGNQFVGKYPLYFISYDDMNTKIPFAEALMNAKNNDPNLYNDLARLVSKTNYDYYLNPQKLSAYAFASINVTKEIGNFASVSFNAVNFLNTLQLVKSSWTNLYSSLYGSSYIPGFFYGLSLRLKL